MVFKMFLSYYFIVFLLCFVLASEQQQPNIVFIVADDLGWDDVSFHGSNEILTPNIDMLAKSGVILNNYYVQHLCTPSRSALMTGRYPIHTGMQHFVIWTGCAWGLPPELKLIPNWMKSLGYVTHGIGKWHLGFHKTEYLPTRRGFDTYYGTYNGGGDYWDHSHANSNAGWGLDLHDNEKPVWDQWGNYSTDLFTDVAIDHIRNHDKDKPMFLYLSHQATHTANKHDPFQAPTEWIKKFNHIKYEERRKYAAMAGSLDYGVGRVYKALKDASMIDNTVIIFTSDNGARPAVDGHTIGSNYPLRGSKKSLWEGGVRASAFVHSKLIQSPGRVSNGLFHITDWLPTLYQLGGGDPNSIPNLDGINIWNAISKNESSPRNEILLNYDPLMHNSPKSFALRVGDYKVILAKGDHRSDWFSPYGINGSVANSSVDHDAVVRCGPVPSNVTDCSAEQGGACLFNIKDDPCEYNNLANVMPQLYQEMLETVEKYGESMVTPRNNFTVDPLSNPNLHGGVWQPWQSDKTVSSAGEFRRNTSSIMYLVVLVINVFAFSSNLHEA